MSEPQTRRHRGSLLDAPTRDQRRQVFLLGACLLALTVTTSLVTFSNPPADAAASAAVADWFSDGGLVWMEAASSNAVVLGLAASLLVGARCRVFLPAAAVALLTSTGLAWLLAQAVGLYHPAGLPDPRPTSFPSVSVTLVTVLAGLLLAALRHALPRRAHSGATVILALLVLAAGTGQVATVGHGVLEAVGGVLLGVGVVMATLLALGAPRLHHGCRSCPWPRREAQDGSVDLTTRTDRAGVVHAVALAWVVGLIGLYGLLSLTVGLPRTPESGVMGGGLEGPLLWGAVGLLLAGVLIARRWHLTGAGLMAIAAVVLAYASSVQYPPLVSLLVLTTAWAPGLLVWLEWHRVASLRAALTVAVVVSAVLGSVVAASAMTYSSYWGPTHPVSDTAAPAPSSVRWMWVGGVTPGSAEVRLRTAHPAETVRVVASPRPDLSDPIASLDTSPDPDGVARAVLSGLDPDTRYYYGASVDGSDATARVQQFTTFPVGAASFTVALGSCQVGGSNGQVFDVIRSLDPLLFLSMGDWNYGNIETDDPDLFAAQFDLNLTAPAQAALYGRTATAYVWGDHDYGGNDADRTSPSRPAAMATYRQLVPHYELAGPTSTVHQAFTVGRVRFLLLDTRAARDPVTNHAGEYRSTLGAEQREWLLGELADAGQYGLVVLVNPDPWVGAADPGSDTWAGFAEERTVIADAIARHAPDNLLMVSGDAHMLAFDDGTHTDYTSVGGSDGFPLLHAAAIDRPGSVKGGPYSGPVLPGGGQFGSLDVVDDGTRIEVTLTGWNWRSQRLFTRALAFPRDGVP